MGRQQRKQRLYDSNGQPNPDLNERVLHWLSETAPCVEHAKPAAFEGLRSAIGAEVEKIRATGRLTDDRDIARFILSNLTELMYGVDLSALLAERLSADNINPTGFRTAHSQGVAKNTGENFPNAMVYLLAQLLRGQDDILVDKGFPPPLHPYLRLIRDFEGTKSGTRSIDIPIECDLAIWSRNDPSQAVIVSAKTRLKEIFHIGTMWKILFDMIGDDYAMKKWRLRGPSAPLDATMVFATADMIPKGGTKTQGPDVEREEVRNLIAMDASFFDYVFVSKTNEQASHISDTLNISDGREALFHELGCIIDLIEQKFGITL